MKVLLATLVVVSVFMQGWSITCYRCGGAAPSCEGSGSATVKCDDSSMPGSVFACQVYTANFTSYDEVRVFKSCCLYEDCNKDPCKEFGKEIVCSKMASCQEDKCNFDYDSAKASQPPTLPSEASSVTLGKVLEATLIMALSMSLFI
ncbi:uncharacterized protein LOC111334619 [Stylophora pistillata]|uniref:uncharacterized protein LOC111334619 n=1 Tax=Stylophora pistillata TaxID=50429 RepID=UPI000C039175|nr:uncharacterized protein LOC111334619 [Stylophora pistillata]